MSTEISAKLVKELRDMTGAGMMDCKKALQENNADVEAAKDWLRAKGIASAASRSGRAANEGVIHSYVHQGGRIGVMVEINCETDFVARTDAFDAFAHQVAMQIAAMKPMVVSADDVPEDVKERERAIYAEQALDRPEAAREKIVEGKLAKYLREVSLLDQEFFLDQTEKKARTMEELRAETSTALGENISIRRFTIFQLGG